MIGRVFQSRKVWVAAGGLLAAILVAASDGKLDDAQAGKIVDLILGTVVPVLILAIAGEDAAHKIQLPWGSPAPQIPPAVLPTPTADDPTGGGK